jgi:MOSC domain-containing protein
MTNLVVSGLSIYPVKSCREVKINATRVESFGLKNDRRWMVVDEQGVMLTQRKMPKMCLIQPEIIEAGLILNHSKKDSLKVEVPTTNQKINVTVWEDECQAYDAGDEAAYWLTQVLSIKCRLVYFPENEFRQVDLNYANEGDKTAFSDGFPILLISQASLNDLNSRLEKPVAMNRFRPNIVVEGCDAFAEDSWKEIQIGDTIYRIVKPCSRCAIPSINIETGEKEDEPLKTLVTYRKRNSKIFFGQNVIANTEGEIEVGMPVKILS